MVPSSGRRRAGGECADDGHISTIVNHADAIVTTLMTHKRLFFERSVRVPCTISTASRITAEMMIISAMHHHQDQQLLSARR
jgi:hypothetical protein